jgi:hypothetical protein
MESSMIFENPFETNITMSISMLSISSRRVRQLSLWSYKLMKGVSVKSKQAAQIIPGELTVTPDENDPNMDILRSIATEVTIPFMAGVTVDFEGNVPMIGRCPVNNLIIRYD